MLVCLAVKVKFAFSYLYIFFEMRKKIITSNFINSVSLLFSSTKRLQRFDEANWNQTSRVSCFRIRWILPSESVNVYFYKKGLKGKESKKNPVIYLCSLPSTLKLNQTLNLSPYGCGCSITQFADRESKSVTWMLIIRIYRSLCALLWNFILLSLCLHDLQSTCVSNSKHDCRCSH